MPIAMPVKIRMSTAAAPAWATPFRQPCWRDSPDKINPAAATQARQLKIGRLGWLK